jgi:hypothetical protein
MDHQEETGVPLDGNAAAGLLRERFALDVTAAEVTCGSCVSSPWWVRQDSTAE